MTSWVENGVIAVVIGGMFFLACFLPGLLWQYRRYGGFSFPRMLGLAAICLYGTALFTYTFFPLPEISQQWCEAHAAHMNLRPFQFLDDIRRETVGLTPLQIVKSFAVLQVAFNVLLFVPLGVIVRRYFHRSVITTIVVGFLVSLLIEATQLTGLWGLYPCAFRAADVDDLMANTLGAALGILLAPAALFWMPHAHKLREQRLNPRKVTTMRRWLGMLVDLILIVTLTLVLQAPLAIARGILGMGTSVNGLLPWAFIGAWVIVFLWPAWSGSGASIGQTAVWLTPKWRKGGQWTDGSRLQRLAHASVIPGMCALLLLVNSISPSELDVLTLPLVAAAFIVVPFTRSRGIAGLVTGAEMRDARDR
ncbi:VanZ family protein [Tessaracoccus massiliensis]|uniref:VanZ family protein n=1 Tax=Tessaracoccus massiliensis TaxID=1522311 RepID=UPI000693C7E5|nr:VanZ family protein [Tessaracoccus massiliensis]